MKIAINAKKTLLAAALFCSALALSFPLDFGGSIANFTRVKGNNFSNLKLDQVNDLLAWIKVPLNKDGSSYFAVQALYEFEHDAFVEKTYNRVDINLAKYVGAWNVAGSPLTLSAGRFFYTDLSGLVMKQNCDGVNVSVEFPRVVVSAYAGFTGLLNSGTVKILNHKNDPYEYKTDKVYQVCERYVVASVGASVPNLFSTQTLSGQFLAAVKTSGKSFNRFYATLDMTGPIYKTIYYDASTTLGLQSFDGGSFEATNLTRAEVKWFAPFKDLTVGAGAVYASGGKDGKNAFTGFTKIDACFSMKEPQYTSLFKAYASASIKPLPFLLARSGAGLVFNFAKDSGGFQGFEWNVGADYQIVSDACVGASFQQYIDKDDSDASKVQISLNASLSF